ncbi:putative ribonuclease H-like domain-containing protein [Tanacetum coccineum]
MSFDDLYNNFKIVEQEVKRTGTSSSNSSSQNMAFVSTLGSTNEANTINVQVSTTNSSVSTDSNLDSTTNLSDATVYAFLANQPNGSQLIHEDLEQIHEDDLEKIDLKWHLALLSMRARKYYQRTRKKITINGSDTAGYDKSKVECFNCHKMGHFVRECREDTSSKAMVAIDGAGFDLSFMVEEEVTTNMALMAFSDSEVYNDETWSNTCLKSSEALKTQLDNLRVEFNKSEFNLATYKRGLAFVEEQLVFYKKNEKLKNEKECNQIKINKFENASKSLDKLIGSQISDNSRKGVGYNAVPPPPIGLFAPSIIDLSYSGLEEFQQPEFEGYGPKASKSVCVDTSNEVKKTSDTPLVEELVSEKEKQTVFPKQQDKTARKPVKYAEMYRSQKPRINQRNWNNLKSQQLGSNFVMYNKACFVCGSFDHIQAHCKYHQRERMIYGNNYNRVNYNYTTNMTHPNAQRNMAPRAVLMKTGLKSFNTARTINIAHPKSIVYSAKLVPKAVNTARPNSAVVNTVRDNQANAVKTSACCVWRPTKLDSASITLKSHNYIDARGRSKSISRSLMEDMLPLEEESEEEKSLVKMCDKKNCVLFTDTAYFVLSHDFKLPNESQILLKIPRKNNMYSVDMKNIVPKESLTCLVAKATLDESMLWHRRLGHINFKTINKLVKDNLVRGLPSKRFENDQTCVACLKGKQHKASCIKREYSVARNPQQNGVVERRNRTLIEAATIMLAGSKLPTTFWAEVVNTACYVHNRVIIVKPHNKTPYELFRGRTPALSFMRPFRCHVSILNTLDHLSKFDGKSNDGFFVGYSLTSKAFRVYNIRNKRVEENLHIRFLEDKPIVSGNGPKWLFDIDSLTKLINYVPVIAGIYSNDFAGSEVSIGKDSSLFDSPSMNVSHDELEPSCDAEKKDDEGVSKENRVDDQEKPESSTPYINTAGPSINTASANLKTEMDMSNLNASYQVPTTQNTRIHKDHSLDHVIGDIQSGVHKRGMTKTANEQGFLSAVYEGKTHEDLHTCMFFCFLSQEEPKRVTKALSDSAWVEAMQEELL